MRVASDAIDRGGLMNSLPLHPAIVHLPLGLAMLMPILAAGFAWALWTGRVRTRAWLAIVALQAMLLGAGLVAINTGGAEEDRVEDVVQRSALHQHEEFAEQFAWASGATLVLTALVLVFRRPGASRVLTATAVVSTLAVAGLGLRAGHAGGQLVYVHGAAAAYTSGTQASPASPSGASAVARQDDDDDEGHQRRVR
jgi:uncharacterized membrane protein